ncbi:hypothetical protein [Reichenbachiella versicolor]|uniref:hypothetical protein n=1 Tax=Reichenbachiella versicolor TaxID=1821036 RepID=UPI0013A55624|nr:hypothetical protein [Reichenbachiella versicolor]
MSYLLFIAYHLTPYLKLNNKLKANDLTLIKARHSKSKRIKNYLIIPAILIMVFLVMLFSEEYGIVGFFAFPMIFYLILWFISLAYYDLWYGIIITDKQIISEKDAFQINSINEIFIKDRSELIVNHAYRLGTIKINIEDFHNPDLNLLSSIIKQRADIDIKSA